MENIESKKKNIFKKWWFWTAIVLVVVVVFVLMTVSMVLFMESLKKHKPALSISNNALSNTRSELMDVLNSEFEKDNMKISEFKETKGNEEARKNNLTIYESKNKNDVVIQCMEHEGKIVAIRTYVFLDSENGSKSLEDMKKTIGIVIRKLGNTEYETDTMLKDLEKTIPDGKLKKLDFDLIVQKTDYYETLLIVFDSDNVEKYKIVTSEVSMKKLVEEKKKYIVNTYNKEIKELNEKVKKENVSKSDLKTYKTKLESLKTKIESGMSEFMFKDVLPDLTSEKEGWNKDIDELIDYINSKINVSIPDFNGMTASQAVEWGKNNEVTVTTSTEYSDSVENGKVISQSVEVGKSVTKGSSSVRIVYSIGRKPTISETNALKKAKSYSDNLYLSKNGIYRQLTSEYGEGFTEAEATYAIEHLDVDWNQNALKKAKSYQKNLNMSKKGIYNQLVSHYGEDFTASEAQYAVDHLDD